METEDTEPATSSQAPAVAAPIRLFVTRDDETMEQEGPESKRQRTVASLPVCSLLHPVDEILVSYVATHEIDERPVYDQKKGERSTSGKGWSTDRVRGNDQTSTIRTCADRIGSRQDGQMSMAGRHERGEQMDHSCSAGSLRWKWATESELIHFAGTAPLKCIKVIISRAASIKNDRGPHTRVLALYDISDTFWHSQLPHDEPIAMYLPRGKEEAGYMWQMKRAMYGTTRAARLFQEHMKVVLGEAGYATLKVCHQVFYCIESDSMAASHGDDIIAEGEPEKLDRLDEVLRRLVVATVLDRIGPRAVEYGWYLKRHIVYSEGQGFESGWKIRNTLLRPSETVPRQVQRSRALLGQQGSGEK